MSEPLNPDTLPDSPHARELRGGFADLRFSPELEHRYVQGHLQRVRLRVRTWFSLSALLGINDLVQQLHGVRHERVSWAHDVVRACSLSLAWLAWSNRYWRWYQPVARIAVPLSGIGFAIFVAADVATQGHAQIAILTTNVFVAYFFCGLLFRAALATNILIVLAFLGAAQVFGQTHQELGSNLLMILVATAVAAIGYLDIERSYRRGFLENALIAELVRSDELSGLTNRRAFYEHLLRLWQQAQRENRPLAICMIDVDNFKAYNDSLGHQAGDAALRGVGQLLKGFARRPLDLAARYGGDEFVAVLYDLPPARVHELAESLRKGVQDYHLQQQTLERDLQLARLGSADPGPDGPGPADAPAGPGPVTVSIGVAVVTPTPGRSMQGAVQLADQALYEAKQGGRNRVVVKDTRDHQLVNTGSFRHSRTA